MFSYSFGPSQSLPPNPTRSSTIVNEELLHLFFQILQKIMNNVKLFEKLANIVLKSVKNVISGQQIDNNQKEQDIY